MVGETAQPSPVVGQVAVDGLGDLEARLAEVGQGVLELDRLGLLRGRPWGPADSSSSVSTKLPSGARPGPLLGRPSSGRTSRRTPVMPVRSVSATIVTIAVARSCPPTRIEPSGCLGQRRAAGGAQRLRLERQPSG